MTDLLERIVAGKRAEAAALASRRSALRQAAEAARPARPFAAALRRAGEVAVIGEVKRRSPSGGALRPDLRPAEVAGEYAGAGAAAISVLTDEEHFGGTLSDLEAVRSSVAVPVLRKDFLVDAAQVWEARAAGADAVLLIVRILADAELAELLAVCAEAGVEALVEAHDRAELERALAAGARVVGINNRDLATLRIDLETTAELAPAVPADVVVVGESGIRSAADVDRLGLAGVDAVLVGESLMRSPDVAAATAALVGRPRRERG